MQKRIKYGKRQKDKLRSPSPILHEAARDKARQKALGSSPVKVPQATHEKRRYRTGRHSSNIQLDMNAAAFRKNPQITATENLSVAKTHTLVQPTSRPQGSRSATPKSDGEQTYIHD